MSLTPYAREHADAAVKGPGDGRPTALKIVEDQGLVGKLGGSVAIVTGATSGIGVETARALHKTGADVYITARDKSKAESALEQIRTDGGGKLEVLQLELDSLDSVRRAADDFLSKSDRLNILINNAGIMACPKTLSKDGHELQFATNHLGHFLFFQLLKPTLLASSTPQFHSRVVSLSSSGHRGCQSVNFDDLNFEKTDYDKWRAYAHSKTANIYFANEINRTYGSQGINANSVMPGGIMTGLQKHVDPKIMEQMAKSSNADKYGKSVEQGAATSVWAALGKELEGRGGMYLEDCGQSPETGYEGNLIRPGWVKHAFDPEAEAKLWDISEQLCKL